MAVCHFLPRRLLPGGCLASDRTSLPCAAVVLTALRVDLAVSGSQTLTLQIPLRTDTGTKNSMHQGYSGTGVLSLTRLEFMHLS